MKIAVDLNKCQSYAQCIYAAPSVFWMHGEESLEFDYTPDEALRGQVERAAAACPVRAIKLQGSDEQIGVGKTDVEGVSQ